MDASATLRLRVRHAFRCAIGGACIAAVSLTTSASSGCTPSVLFFISTVAGTSENLQGFQLRSASLTFLGALLGALIFTAVAAITAGSTIGTFFAALPMIAFLSALRADKELTPMPAVANVYMGFLLISRFGTPRRELPRDLAAFVAEATIAWAAAILVNTLPPTDRAGAIGRHIIAQELRRMGAIISSVATRTLSPHLPSSHHRHDLPPTAPHLNDSLQHTQDFTMFLAEGLEENALNAGLLRDDFVFLTSHLPHRMRSQRAPTLAHSAEMLRAAERSLSFMQDLRPFGRTRVSDYASLARAAQLFAASAYEPQLLPEAASRWRNVCAWNRVIENMRAVVNKVSSLESVACMSEQNGEVLFSKELLLQFFGEAYAPLWVCHFASCAAACAKMSSVMCRATCKDMFHLPDIDQEHQRNGAGEEEIENTLDWTIDPRRWNTRRADMYFGFLLRYRLGLRNYARNDQEDLCRARNKPNPLSSVNIERSLFRRPLADDKDDTNFATPQGIRRSISLTDMKTLERTCKTRDRSTLETRPKVPPRSRAEIQALSYFAITSHALSEEISHVQQSMTALAESSDARGVLAPFYFLVSGLPTIWHRIKALATGQVEEWEVRFAFTHSMLLSSILALALFLPIRVIEASEIAWVFTSAALAAQLSAEPTLFIGTIRVFATLTGAIVSFGFNSILQALDRSSNPSVQYVAIPYIFVVTMVCLLLVPPTFRYAAFLIIVTNAILLFCPRSTPECTKVLARQSADCFPDWRYTLSRAINVSVGVLFALFFHLLFWPRYANQVALRNLSAAFINASRLFGKLHRTYFFFGMDGRNEIIGSEAESPLEKEETMFDDDVYQSDKLMLDEIQKKVGEPLSSAVLIVNSEAGVWRTGPLRLYPLIPRVLPDFVALTVSLEEMAAILGRRPIFSPAYGRSVFVHYILPMLHAYETIQVSLLNLVGITDRTVADKKAEAVRENSFDLHHAITHLARSRSKLRQDAENRSFEFRKFSALALAHRKPCRFSRPGESADELFADMVFEDIGRPGQSAEAKYPRARSSNEMAREDSHSPHNLCVDDVVLYDAFTFITDACLSAFVRIGVAVLIESESQLKELDKKRK